MARARKGLGASTSVAVIGAIFALTILAAMAIVTLLPREYQVFGDDTNSVFNPLYYVIVILVFTGVVLFVVKQGFEHLVQHIIMAAIFISIVYVIYPLVVRLFSSSPDDASEGTVAIATTLGVSLALLVTVLLYVYPEWWVVDISGVFMAVGVTAILGFSIGVLPLILLLAVLAIYDAIAVYQTKHMVALADTVMDHHLPIMLVIPKGSGYSFLEQPSLQEQLDSGEEREAMFMGLGDIIIPGALVVSAQVFLAPMPWMWGLSSNLAVALTTLVGGLCGYLVLMRYVLRGNPQAGLPLLNGGAIGGYLVGAGLLYPSFGFVELTTSFTLPGLF